MAREPDLTPQYLILAAVRESLLRAPDALTVTWVQQIVGATIAYLVGGWPVLVVALTWRRSRVRAELLVERDDLRAARASHT